MLQEVDEEGTEACAGEATVASAGTGAGEGRGRRRDELGEPLGAQFHEFRRRRARRDHPIKLVHTSIFYYWCAGKIPYEKIPPFAPRTEWMITGMI